MVRSLQAWFLASVVLFVSGCSGGAAPLPGVPRTATVGSAQKPSAEPTAVAPADSKGCLTKAPAPPSDAKKVTISRVVDGDTVELRDGTKVRLIGINTPESVDPRRPVQAYGKEASSFAKQLLEGKEVLLKAGRTPRDKYGRMLAWIWFPDGRFVNGLLVQEGYAQVYTFADNPDNADLLLSCQREAREAGRGLWALPDYQSGQKASSMDRQGSTSGTGSPPTPPVSSPAGVTVVKAPGTVARDATATVTVQTSPGSRCSIAVIYKSGPSGAQGLEPKDADGAGQISWSWTVGKNTSTGTWPVTITCGGKTAESAVTVS